MSSSRGFADNYNNFGGRQMILDRLKHQKNRIDRQQNIKSRIDNIPPAETTKSRDIKSGRRNFNKWLQQRDDMNKVRDCFNRVRAINESKEKRIDNDAPQNYAFIEKRTKDRQQQRDRIINQHNERLTRMWKRIGKTDGDRPQTSYGKRVRPSAESFGPRPKTAPSSQHLGKMVDNNQSKSPEQLKKELHSSLFNTIVSNRMFRKNDLNQLFAEARRRWVKRLPKGVLEDVINELRTQLFLNPERENKKETPKRKIYRPKLKSQPKSEPEKESEKHVEVKETKKNEPSQDTLFVPAESQLRESPDIEKLIKEQNDAYDDYGGDFED